MRKRPGPDRIASILRDVQADLDAGLNVHQACRKAGIASTTYYRWKSLQEDPVSGGDIGPGRLGGSLPQGSHRSGLAQLRHPARHVM